MILDILKVPDWECNFVINTYVKSVSADYVVSSYIGLARNRFKCWWSCYHIFEENGGKSPVIRRP